MGFREEILKRVESATDLPTLPGIFTKINGLLSSKNSSANDIAELIRDDPALTTKVLKVTNSAAYGGATKITSVGQAVSRLGFNKMGDIGRSLSVLNLFDGAGIVNYKEFWKHSLSAASATSIIPHHLGKAAEAPAELFTAGLLHDIGIFILEQYTGDLYVSIASMARDTGQQLQLVEQQFMQIDHAEVGALLLEKWNIPDSIVQAVRTHHEDYEPGGDTLTTSEIVKQANFLCNSQGIYNGVGSGNEEIQDEDWAAHGFDKEIIPHITKEIARIIEESSTMLAANAS